MSKLLDHRLNVCEGAIGCVNTSLSLLNAFNLMLHLFTSLLSKLLHVAFYELNLGVEVSVPYIGILKLFFKLEIPNFQLVNRSLILLLFFLQILIGICQFRELSSEFGEL